jgi:hypothetical protein
VCSGVAVCPVVAVCPCVLVCPGVAVCPGETIRLPLIGFFFNEISNLNIFRKSVEELFL